MIRNYKLVPIHDAVPGMVLSDNLLDRHGKILLSAETVLNDKLLESLRRYDIDMIPVKAEALTAEEKAAETQARLDRLNRLFRKHNYGNEEEHANEVLLSCLKDFRQGGDDEDIGR
ncbi:MAG: hypothetical protein C4516_00800 [Oxalobacter sp.]|nr:MAG: hypothetical protein C4516_00800 [Oxalobacter sp.]